MLFRLPHPPLAFEIPDEWWAEANAVGYVATSQSYRLPSHSVSDEVAVSLSRIAPLLRRPEVSQGCHGFRRQGGLDGGYGGMVDVLRAIVGGIHLQPVKVRVLRGKSAEGFGFALQDGFHRFYASHAMGFACIPCVFGSDWKAETQFGDE